MKDAYAEFQELHRNWGQARKARPSEAIARSKKVSVAWVVRDAAEKYVAEQWPLLEKQQ